jgi:sporulation protein YlmC with PRC-barrel domain
MFRALLTTTALTALMSVGVLAQDQNDPQAMPAADQPVAPLAQQPMNSLLAKGYQVVDEDTLATELIGMGVFAGPAMDAERIGDINNFVITENGQIGAVIIGVGGFLGIGEKNVAVDYRELQRAPDENGDMRLILPTTKDALTAAPDFRTVDMSATNREAVPTDGTDTLEGNAARQAQDQLLPVPADQNRVAPPAPDRAQLTEATLTAEELIGTNAYGPNNDHLGVVGELVLGTDSKTIDAVIIDFGGFLGIGRKEVAVSMQNLKFYTDANANRYVYLNVTREQLDKAQEFDKDGVAENRNAQILITQPAL